MRGHYLCVLLMLSSLALAEPIRLNTHDLSPYSWPTENGQAEGMAVRVVQCAAARLGETVHIQFYPWPRAQSLVREGVDDGFFAASQSAERDQYATLSASIAPQQWRWYLLAGSTLDPLSAEFHRSASVGSFRGGNMLDSLRSRGFQVAAAPTQNENLLDMLLAKRVDAILANHLVMNQLIEQRGLLGQLRSVLDQDKPLGVYFAKTFLQRRPAHFMADWNKAVEACRRKRGE